MKIGAWYWPKVSPLAAVGETAGAIGGVQPPSTTARTSRVGGRKVPAWFMTHCLSGLAGTVPNGAQGGRMLWYPSVRLIRQRAIGDWPPVIESVRGLLQG